MTTIRRRSPLWSIEGMIASMAIGYALSLFAPGNTIATTPSYATLQTAGVTDADLGAYMLAAGLLQLMSLARHRPRLHLISLSSLVFGYAVIAAMITSANLASGTFTTGIPIYTTLASWSLAALMRGGWRDE